MIEEDYTPSFADVILNVDEAFGQQKTGFELSVRNNYEPSELGIDFILIPHANENKDAEFSRVYFRLSYASAEMLSVVLKQFRKEATGKYNQKL